MSVSPLSVFFSLFEDDIAANGHQIVRDIEDHPITIRCLIPSGLHYDISLGIDRLYLPLGA